MDNHTFHSRLSKLLQRSRKALRLYTTMGRMHPDGGGEFSSSEFSEIQVAEWKYVNAELIKRLTSAMETSSGKKLVADVFSLRDEFHHKWRGAEADLHLKQKDLIAAAENADFGKSALLSKELIPLKARVQACQAAHHELSDVLKRSRVVQPSVEVVPEEEQEELLEEPVYLAKVIPLAKGARRR